MPDQKQPDQVPASGFIVSMGVGLRTSEIELLDQLAEKLGVTRNFSMRWLIRRGLADYLAEALPDPPRKLP